MSQYAYGFSQQDFSQPVNIVQDENYHVIHFVFFLFKDMYDVYQPSQNEHHQLLSQDSNYIDPTNFINSQGSNHTNTNRKNF